MISKLELKPRGRKQVYTRNKTDWSRAHGLVSQLGAQLVKRMTLVNGKSTWATERPVGFGLSARGSVVLEAIPRI